MNAVGQLNRPLADRAAATTVSQRTPAWLIPTPDHLDPVDDRLRWLLARIPGYQRWHRFWLLRGPLAPCRVRSAPPPP